VVSCDLGRLSLIIHSLGGGAPQFDGPTPCYPKADLFPCLLSFARMPRPPVLRSSITAEGGEGREGFISCVADTLLLPTRGLWYTPVSISCFPILTSWVAPLFPVWRRFPARRAKYIDTGIVLLYFCKKPVQPEQKNST
jgi:hypothetical protein